MAKVMIIEKTDNGLKVANTNVPFEEIEKFLKDYCKQHNGEVETEQTQYHNEIEKHLAEKYPDFYADGKKEDVYDDEFFDALEEMAKDMNYSAEEMADGLVTMATHDFGSAAMMATAVIVAKKKLAMKK